MTKKEYLESIGYEYNRYDEYYEKVIVIGDYEVVATQIINLKYNNFSLWVETFIHSQEHFDILQNAFNNMKRDFEEMMKYKEE